MHKARWVRTGTIHCILRRSEPVLNIFCVFVGFWREGRVIVLHGLLGDVETLRHNRSWKAGGRFFNLKIEFRKGEEVCNSMPSVWPQKIAKYL